MAEGRREVRLSQTIVPFGVGGIFDIFGESYVACDTYYWRNEGTELHSDALARALGVPSFKSPWTSAQGGGGVPYLRFPGWLFCQRCRRLIRWRREFEREDEPAICLNTACRGRRKLVPMRFIVVCEENGHLADVPWDFWAHSHSVEGRRCEERQTLEFRGRPGAGSGLDTLEVRCLAPGCGASRSLSGITASDSLKNLGYTCSGRQPWQRLLDATGCASTPRVVQRGASNVYFAAVASALDIPIAGNLAAHGEKTLAIRNHPSFATLLQHLPKSTVFGPMLVQMIASDTGATEAEVRHVAAAATSSAGEERVEPPDILLSEWLAFQTPQAETSPDASFITRETSLLTATPDPTVGETRLATAVNRVVLATKLKEIRALRGFSRYSPGAKQLRPDLTISDESQRRRVPWLPAIEVFGEGIFLALDEAVVVAWENRPQVIERAARLDRRVRESEFGGSIIKRELGDGPITPRFLLLHTLAHVLIRELSFETGYSTSSMRERIYCAPAASGAPQAGILVYTAAGDAEGTLGGLVRQGESPRLARSLLKSLESALWCSADPLCRESAGQGYDKTNLAACHACTLLPETSCVFANMLLDRLLLVASDVDTAFFGDPLRDLAPSSP